MFFSKKNNNNNNINEEKYGKCREDRKQITIVAKNKGKSLKNTINKKYLKNGSYSSYYDCCICCYHYCYKYDSWKFPSKYTSLISAPKKLYTIGDETKQC